VPFRRRPTPTPKRRRIRKLRVLVLLLVVLLLSIVAFTYGLVTAIASEIPKLDPANQTRELAKNGYIYASDGKTVLATLRGDENRVVLKSQDIAPVMKQAIVAVEDKRFWEHRGVDLRGVARALWADITQKQLAQGGSTITQQFVKNMLFRTNDRSVARKVKEAALAWQLERQWSKDRILTAYLNTIFFGNGAHGIHTAARLYFGKTAADLTLAEAALLAGIPSNPALYDPIQNPAEAKERRSVVLDLMRAQGLASVADVENAEAESLPKSVRLPDSSGPEGHFVEYVKQQLIPYYGEEEVYGGGLRVKTTIDLRLQEAAREAIREWLPSRNGPQAALVAIDPRDGRVLAMSGGRSFEKSQFNLAVQGQRQSGSAFKPFVLAAALKKGIAPQTSYVSEPTLINLGDKLWSVANYENSYLGTIDLVEATTFSDNAVYAQLTAQVGPSNVAEMAHSLGVTSRLREFFAIGLGVEAVNPLEMARAFSTFANDGERIDGSVLGNAPRAVEWVARDCDGVSRTASRDDCAGVDENDPVSRRALDENKTAILNSILQSVVRDGTGHDAALSDRPVAGKTGTTENYGDAWFVGYTPQLAVAVWVGYPKTLRPMLTEFEGEPVAGGTFPALIWKSFAQTALQILGEPPELFTAPVSEYAAPYTVVFRDGKWLLDNGNCEDTRQVVYVVGSEPAREAACKPNEVDVPRVVGASLEDAEARIRSMPLVPEVLYRPAKPGEPLGVVVKQIPSRGTLSAFDAMKIVLAESPDGALPRLVGLSLGEARILLSRREIRTQVVRQADGPIGVVLAQDPKPRRAAVRGMTVRLVVGRG
jgi:penicillin-binding protein 1A